ncbi:MAG: glycosyltransferase family 2 protein [Desulfovibrio sp.]|nr:glycosyltransferase family 2 protein [Desulfovibrio sp.]
MYNNWPLTAQCLESIAVTTPKDAIEVLVIDNASSDQTQANCNDFGERLFQERFKYIRLEQNKNYAGANNIGALEAKGDYLFLLNNDTILLADWLKPLLTAITTDKSLGAIGPLLLSPKQNDIFHIQHAGVAVSLNKQVSQLYEGIEYPHKLLRKKRFFQIITGAAFLIKNSVFREFGGFNEKFINGFEDVEFCYRLSQANYRQTVIPESVIIHYGRQSDGRGVHDEENSQLCAHLCPKLLFDEANFFRADGYCATLSPWGLTQEPTLEPTLPVKKELALLTHVKTLRTIEQLQQIVREEPYWSTGALMLANQLEASGKLNAAFETFAQLCRLRSTPDTLLPFYHFLQRHDQKEELSTLLEAMQSFETDEHSRLNALYDLREQLQPVDADLTSQIDTMISTNSDFFRTEYKKILTITV